MPISSPRSAAALVGLALLAATQATGAAPLVPGPDTPGHRALARGMAGKGEALDYQIEESGPWIFEAFPVTDRSDRPICTLRAESGGMLFQVIRRAGGAAMFVLDLDPTPADSYLNARLQTDGNRPYPVRLKRVGTGYLADVVAAPGLLEEMAAGAALTVDHGAGPVRVDLAGAAPMLAHFRACEARIGTLAFDKTVHYATTVFAASGWTGGGLYRDGRIDECVLFLEGDDVGALSVQSGFEQDEYFVAVKLDKAYDARRGATLEAIVTLDETAVHPVNGIVVWAGFAFRVTDGSALFRNLRDAGRLDLSLPDGRRTVRYPDIAAGLRWLTSCATYYGLGEAP